MRPAALIFDVDGTLAETEEAHRRAFNETFAEAGLDWHWSRDTYAELLSTTGGKERMRVWRETTGSGPDDAAIAELHVAKTARFGTILANGGLALRPGVAALIEAARLRGQRVAVATTTSRPNVDALCQSCWGQPAEAIFDVIAAGDEVPAKKPAPDVYLLALERLGLTAADAVALEDSRNGVLSAQAAGLPVIVTPSAFTAADDFTGAQAVIPSLAAEYLPASLR